MSARLGREAREAAAGASGGPARPMHSQDGMNTLWFEPIIWALIGLMLGAMQRFFNLWRGPGWRVALVGAIGGVLGGLAVTMIPTNVMTIGAYDAMAFFGAMVGAIALQIIVGVATHRNRTDPLTS